MLNRTDSIFLIFVFSLITIKTFSQEEIKERIYNYTLSSVEGHNGMYDWKMKKADELATRSEDVSTLEVSTKDWMPAIVPGTVLNSLVYNDVYPEPYYGVNNKLESQLIPDLYHAGRDFYTYWFRTEFNAEESLFKDRKIWMQVDGINYRAEIWLNGKMVGNLSGMFLQKQLEITDYVVYNQPNVLAVKVYPVDSPGTIKPKGGKSFGAEGEFQNGGNGEIGRNVTQLMTVGWDFTFLDGIRDRNTGIWKDIKIFTTGKTILNHPFVKSELAKPNYDSSKQTVSVEVAYPNYLPQNSRQKVKVIGEIKGENIHFEKEVALYREEVRNVVFTPEEFPQLIIANPRLWWPVNKGKQELYDLVLKTEIDGVVTDSIFTRFGIREITSTTETPDQSRTFHVNGKPIFIRGTNWLPENMLRTSNERTHAQLRYSAQSGINLIRFWGAADPAGHRPRRADPPHHRRRRSQDLPADERQLRPVPPGGRAQGRPPRPQGPLQGLHRPRQGRLVGVACRTGGARMNYVLALLLPPLSILFTGRPILSIVVFLIWVPAIIFSGGLTHPMFILLAWILIYQSGEERRTRRIERSYRDE